MSVRIPAMPAQYDPDAIVKGFRDFADALGQSVEPEPTSTADPQSDEPTGLSIFGQSGTYGGAQDPRVAGSVSRWSSANVNNSARERFSLHVSSFTLPPLLRAPMLNVWAIAGTPDLTVAFGMLVPRIPHQLGRVPTRARALGSFDSSGNRDGQRVRVAGGTILTAGQNLRVDIDFIPVFGSSPEAIERNLKHLFGFWDGTTVQSEHAFDSNVAPSGAGDNTFESPSFLREVSASLVTSRSSFGGLLVATTWGLTTFNAAVHRVVAGAVVHEREATVLRDPVTGQLDAMALCPLPAIGKSLAGIVVPAASGSLAVMLANGFTLQMDVGSVDFEVS